MEVYNHQNHYEYQHNIYTNDYLAMRGYANDGINNNSNGNPQRSSEESNSSRASRLRRSSADDRERRVSHESKPRLSKDQQEALEKHFLHHPKPSTAAKKGFADAMEIPLEKVNNWFQNRRAKSKQDVKKQRNSGSMLQMSAQISQPQMSGGLHDQTSYYTPTFGAMGSGPNPILDRLNTQMLGGISDTLPNGRMDQSEYHYGGQPTFFPQTFVEPTFNDSPDDFNQFFGFGDPYSAYPDDTPHNSATLDFAKSFNPAQDVMEAYAQASHNIPAYPSSTSISEQTQSSRDDNGYHHDMASGDEQGAPLLSRSSSAGATTVMNHAAGALQSPYLPLKEEHGTQGQFGTTPVPAIPHHFFEDSADLPLRPAVQRSRLDSPVSNNVQSSSAGISNNIHYVQEIHTPRPQAHNPSPIIKEEHHKLQVSKSESNISSTQDAFMTQAPADPLVLKSPTSGLAARRRNRPAPAALGGNLRSSSYTNINSPTSPNRGTQDPHVRRIKSSSVLNGRIQKTPHGSAQRSPIGLNFPDGSMPRISRQVSHQSLDAVAMDQSTNDVKPMTPLSAGVASQSQSPAPPHSTHHQQGRPYSTIIESELEHPEATWENSSSMMPNAGPDHGPMAQNYVPSSGAPMDFAPQYAQYPQQGMHYTPDARQPMPQSAPAWQQNFQMPNGIPNNHYAMPYGQQQPAMIPQFMPFAQVPQIPQVPQFPYQIMAAPQSASNNGGFPQSVTRPAGAMPNGDSAVAAMLAAQQQFNRRPSGSMLASAQSMPTLNTTGIPLYQHQPQFHGQQSFQINSHQMQPEFQQFGQMQPMLYSPQHHQSHASMHDASPTHHFENATMPSTPAQPNMRSSSMMSLNMSANMSTMSLSPTGPGRTSTPAIGSFLGSPQSANGMGFSTPFKQSQSPELMIHEYSPREPADPSRLPPKSRMTTPRTFSFQHSGPEHFSASP